MYSVSVPAGFLAGSRRVNLSIENHMKWHATRNLEHSNTCVMFVMAVKTSSQSSQAETTTFENLTRRRRPLIYDFGGSHDLLGVLLVLVDGVELVLVVDARLSESTLRVSIRRVLSIANKLALVGFRGCTLQMSALCSRRAEETRRREWKCELMFTDGDDDDDDDEVETY